ncbi:Ras85D [Symbiodinium natans]|uniref:Ras85D protein n=1 Tax=Symbiodinium natans TaxID=878477 RepID=A0A812RL10_9DINO|nr:Ras85D [Symbiodinium natans]
MGCTGVGKSALVTKFIRRSHACVSFFLAHCHYAARVEGAYRIAFHARDEVLLEHDPTIEDMYRKDLVVKGSPVGLDIVDTAGQETYHSLRRGWLQNGKGFVFVLSLADRQSLDGLSAFQEQIRSIHPEEAPPSVIAANMADLQRWDVSEEDLQRLQAGWPNCVQVLQTSAVTGQNVQEAFEQLCSAMQELQEREHRRQRRVQREAALQLSSSQQSTNNCARCRLAQCFASCTVQ